MKGRNETLLNVVVFTSLLVLSWISVALLTGVFFGIARRAYNWVV